MLIFHLWAVGQKILFIPHLNQNIRSLSLVYVDGILRVSQNLQALLLRRLRIAVLELGIFPCPRGVYINSAREILV